MPHIIGHAGAAVTQQPVMLCRRITGPYSVRGTVLLHRALQPFECAWATAGILAVLFPCRLTEACPLQHAVRAAHLSHQR